LHLSKEHDILNLVSKKLVALEWLRLFWEERDTESRGWLSTTGCIKRKFGTLVINFSLDFVDKKAKKLMTKMNH